MESKKITGLLTENEGDGGVNFTADFRAWYASNHRSEMIRYALAALADQGCTGLAALEELN